MGQRFCVSMIGCGPLHVYASAESRTLSSSSSGPNPERPQEACAAIVKTGDNSLVGECLDPDALDDTYVKLWRLCNFCKGIWALRCREYRRDYTTGFSEGGVYAEGGDYHAGDPFSDSHACCVAAETFEICILSISELCFHSWNSR